MSWREVGDEVIVLDLKASVYLSLNHTGRALWLRLSSGADPEQLAETLVEQFALDSARARADVDDFLRALSSRTLLEDA